MAGGRCGCRCIWGNQGPGTVPPSCSPKLPGLHVSLGARRRSSALPVGAESGDQGRPSEAQAPQPVYARHYNRDAPWPPKILSAQHGRAESARCMRIEFLRITT